MTKSKAIKRATYHHGNLRDELVNHGIQILETDGLSALTIREIAGRLGVSATAPLHHFDSKLALLAAIAAQGFRMLFDFRMAALKGCNAPEDRLMAVLLAYVEFAVAHPVLYRVMHGPEIPDKTAFPELDDAATRSYGLLETAVADYLMEREGSVDNSREATLGAWTVCQGLATALTNPQNTPRYVLRKDPMGVARRVFMMLLRGLTAPA